MLAEGFVTGQESAAAPEGFAERATDHGDVSQPESQSPPSVTEHAEGVCLVQQQLCSVLSTQCGQLSQSRTGSLHAEQAFRDHQQRSAWTIVPALPQQLLQRLKVVVGKSPEAGTAGLHPHQQGVMNQPIRQHDRVPVRQSAHSRQIGLETAGKQQHPFAFKPLGQSGFQLLVHRARAAHQARSSGSCTTAQQFRMGCSDHSRMAAQAQVVVAGQIQQSLTGISQPRLQATVLPCW